MHLYFHRKNNYFLYWNPHYLLCYLRRKFLKQYKGLDFQSNPPLQPRIFFVSSTQRRTSCSTTALKWNDKSQHVLSARAYCEVMPFYRSVNCCKWFISVHRSFSFAMIVAIGSVQKISLKMVTMQILHFNLIYLILSAKTKYFFSF